MHPFNIHKQMKNLMITANQYLPYNCLEEKACIYGREASRLYMLLALIIPMAISAQNTLTISGGHLTATDGTIITLQNTDWDNDGTFTSGNSTVRFTGTSDNTIGGTSTTDFYNVEMAKTGTTVQLNQAVDVDNELRFTDGFFDLNSHDATLGSATGRLINENEGSRVIGANGGELVKTLDLNAPNTANPGNLGAVLTSAANLGSTEIRRGHQAQTVANGDGINRYYSITPSTNAELDADVQFNYFIAELNGLDETTVEAWRSDTSSMAAWYDYPVASRDDMAPAVTINGVDTLSRLTLGPATIKLSARLLLEGPNSGGSMNDNLRAANHIPTTEPYSGLGYTQVDGGGEQTSSAVLANTGTDAIVDWVLIELRDASDNTTAIATRSALLQADGDVVDIDGTSPISWRTLAGGDYHVVVRHRNHLGAMSLNTFNLSTAPTTVDFTSIPTFGSNAQKDLGSGLFGLYAGSANGDGQINAVDANLYWRPQNGQPYDYLGSTADFNLDGAVNAVDSNLFWRPNNSVTEQLP